MKSHRAGPEQGHPSAGGLGATPSPQLGHPPDFEEKHLSNAQQAGGDGEDEEGDAKEDVLGLVPPSQREGGTGEQKETTAQEPLWGHGGVTGTAESPPSWEARGFPRLTCRR